VAQGAKLGDYFQYAIDQPVSLPRQKSAMLPIINSDIEAARVTIYNEKTQAKHPLLGVKLKNNTKLHLMQGPVTVFEGDSYAGDARIADLQPNEERLLSYAIDLGVEVKPETRREPEQLTQVKINKGVLERYVKLREIRTYVIANRSDGDRVLVLEHPVRAPEFKLVKPEKPSETARDVYRFEVKVAKGESKNLAVVEERDTVSQVSLTNLDDQTMRFFLESPAVSAKAKAALQKAAALKAKVSATQREIALLERQAKTAVDEQARLRENMKVVDKTDPAYKTFQAKLLNLETDIEKVRGQVKKLQEQEEKQRQEYEEYLANLKVEE
jgi:hypothetical protein